MKKEQRNVLRNAVVKARRLLEKEVSDQLEGLYNILPNGEVLGEPGPGDPVVRERLLELVAHYEALGAPAKEAVDRVTRELAFTTLNRFAALKMAERRELVRECVSKGLQSDGLRELADCAPGLAAASADGGYRLLLEAVMDEISLGLKVLFDRRIPMGLLWPRPKALDELLDILNAPELANLWEEGETIGWVYQYFNGDDVKRMRDESPAPRNSRELAVRNQFFTPRYVVEFLVDNTLGRVWMQMTGGSTRLAERCRYLVRDEQIGMPRRRKDPRDLKMLDPACGSAHFLLYGFDLLELIYQEAWDDEGSPPSELTGRTLREDYQDLHVLRREIPGLILRHNLHGIEIDPRAAQIAALALWLRAQRAYQQLGIEPADRPIIGRANLVVAEPMPGEQEMLDELLATLTPKLLGQLVQHVFEQMKLAGETGSLLRIEADLRDAIAEAKRQWLVRPQAEQLDLFPKGRRPEPEQMPLFDLSGVTDEQFWADAESRVIEVLHTFTAQASARQLQRKLFAEDIEHGFAFIDLCRRRFDVVWMNPPFGEPSKPSKAYIQGPYDRTKNDLYAAFVERGIQLLVPGGMVGAITSRTGFFLSSFQRWREEVLLKEAPPVAFADLGYGVLDSAMVEVAAYCLQAAGDCHTSVGSAE